ncbi:Sec-independent protein translocase subunit TatB [Vibrio sp. SCSIO 43136]|nr:Sec-independent protein translocase subunit TatB [Vibrio sp. SCSIO 43136]
MFDIGFWELVLISVVGLVVIGPERLPATLRTVSRYINGAKSIANSVKDELEHELKVQDLQDNLRKVEKKATDAVTPDLKASVDELKQVVQDTKQTS